jgi:hypothetical protein
MRPGASRLVLFLAGVLLMTLPAPAVFGQPESALGAGSGRVTSETPARAPTGGVDPEAIAELVTQGRALGMSESHLSALTGRIIRLAREGLPFEPVLDRVRQGMVKNVGAERIDEVCARLELRLRESAELVDRAFPEAAAWQGSAHDPPGCGRLALIDQTAFALEKGVPSPTLAALFATLKASPGPRPEETCAMQSPVVALTSLAVQGMPAEQGFEFVTGAYRHGVRSKNLEELARAIARAGADEETLRFVRDRLRGGAPPGDIIRHLRERWRHRDGMQRRPRDDTRPPDDPGRRRRGRGNGTGGRP